MKYKVGQQFSREGKCGIEVRGFTADGKYILHKVAYGLKHKSLVDIFPAEVLVAGATLQLPDGRIVELLKGGPGSYTYPADLLFMSEAELNELCADNHAREVFSSVASRRESGGNPSHGSLRFLRKNAAGVT